MDHDWKRQKVTQPTLCFSCHNAIWAPFSKAVRCSTCSLLGHQSCAQKTTVRCTKMAPQSFMAVGVVNIRVIAGLNMDRKTDCVCTLQLDQQTATTRIAFGSNYWNQLFTFVVTSDSRRKLIIECFEQDYMQNSYIGTCIIPHLHEYTQQEEIFVDVQRGGVKTKMSLQVALEYHRIYSHDVVWSFDSSSPLLAPTPLKGVAPQTLSRRLRRRHSAEYTRAPKYFDLTANAQLLPVSSSSSSSPAATQHCNQDSSSIATSLPSSQGKLMSFSLTSIHDNLESPMIDLSDCNVKHKGEPVAGGGDSTSSSVSSNLSLISPSTQMVKSMSLISTREPSNMEPREIEEMSEDDDEEEGEFVVFRDHFGFPIEHSHVEAYLSMFEFQFSTRMKEQAEYLAKNLNKILSCSVSRPIVSREFVGFAKSGFPLSHRADLWQAMSGSRDAMRRHEGLYQKILARHEGVESVATIQIEKDLHRTFIGNPFLRSKSDIGRLQRVLNAFSFYDPQTGYCQSLNFIAALFLLLMSEEEAFWLLIVTTRKYLPEYYTPDMAGSKTDAHIFEAMLYTYFPIVAHQLFDLGLPVVLRTASWFLCMFVTILPIETTMRIFDWMFVEGSQIIFSVGLALFDLSQHNLLQADSFDSAYFTFTTMTSHCFNADQLIDLASSKYHLVRKEIAALRTKLRLEYARRDEQELLSSLNLSPDDFYTLVSHIEGSSMPTTSTATASFARHLSAAASARSAQSTSPTEIAQDASAQQENAEIEPNVLDKAKFVSVFTKLFPDVASSVIESVFDTLDSDEDSALTIKECLLGISAFVVGEPEKKALMWFRVFDKNNDGVLDTAEIRALLSLVWKLIDKQLDHSWIDNFLNVVETTHAGRVMRQEFVAACLEMPVLSEWLKFGFTLGDRVKVLAAKEETSKHVAHHPDVQHQVTNSYHDDDDDKDYDSQLRNGTIPLSSSPPHTWLDSEGHVKPILVAGTVSPLSNSDDDEPGPRHRFDNMGAQDLEEDSFHFV